ncbi:hypothetical protein QJS66_23055 [Kocuria rhizophila]|nr:hypothetical protein QJS66_23055 [Kocuria rhizophila]
MRAVGPGGGPARVGRPPGTAFDRRAPVAQAVAAAARPARDVARAVGRRRPRRLPPHDERSGNPLRQALETAERTGAWDVDSTIGATLDGLGLGGVAREAAHRELSGGQRAGSPSRGPCSAPRTCCCWTSPPTIPDDSAIDFLTATLRSWHGPVLAREPRPRVPGTPRSAPLGGPGPGPAPAGHDR